MNKTKRTTDLQMRIIRLLRHTKIDGVHKNDKVYWYAHEVAKVLNISVQKATWHLMKLCELGMLNRDRWWKLTSSDKTKSCYWRLK